MDGSDDRLGARIEHIISALANRQTLADRSESADIRPGNEAASIPNQHQCLDRRIRVGVIQGLDNALGTPGPSALTGG